MSFPLPSEQQLEWLALILAGYATLAMGGKSLLLISGRAVVAARGLRKWMAHVSKVAFRREPVYLVSVRPTQNDRRRNPRLAPPPGLRLNRFAQWVFSAKTYEQVLQSAIADLQLQYFDALREGRPVKAEWVRLRGYLRFWSHVAAQLPVSMVKVAVRLWYTLP
ncbi:MAG: hypothetical protein KA371_20360 [Acidobacteria bacterium]|nr:hypothetical protein [Acidobacteriota bacterium]